ncbi:hypothetical protein KY289_025846 [Solanum tuberosum]|nr:hypothetical protein KY289_025846 [Solanum tuberosum]KAH0673242.1 hypothetical protein KY284_024329 [Solanum tuberosum]
MENYYEAPKQISVTNPMISNTNFGYDDDVALSGKLINEGIYLTWKDLWVTVPDKKSGRRAILQGLTGYVQPGEVLAIMGPSGCGKSTLLDTLAGRLDSNTRQTGEILINGRRQSLAFGTSAYVTQDDTLMTTLTVKEAIYYSAQLQLPDSMSRSEKRDRAEQTIREMGLQDAINTRIGGWSVKGLSGGQKRRYFALNGFPCPTMRNPSDHYLRTINKDFDIDIEKGVGGKATATEAIDILVKSYKTSQGCQQVQRKVSEICQQSGGEEAKKGSQAGFVTQCMVLTRRSFVNMYRDLGYYWLRFAIYIALCLCVGTIFHDIGHDYGSIQARGSMLMFVAAFLTFMAIGGFPSFVEDMKIFTRERLNGHYGVAAYVVGNTFSSIPYLILISVVPGALAYYLVGLQKGFDHFAYFSLVLFATMMLVESLMMIVASIVPDFLMGIITGAGIQGVMMLNGGFFRLPNDLPKPFWKYPMYYIAFHKYANQGFYKNEFLGLNFPNEQIRGPAIISGEEILRNVWQVQMGYSKWVDVAILFGMVILYRLMFLGIIKTVEKVKPMIRAFMARSSKNPTHAENLDS